MYNCLSGSKTIEMISDTLNKAGYCYSDNITDKKNGKFIFTSTSRNTKVYGSIRVFICKDAIEVKAPRILCKKYLNKIT